MDTKSIARVNGVDIVATNDGQYLPIKPICEALGIAFQVQNDKIKEHPILSSTVTLRVTVAEDGKQREMVCLPTKYIFGWLFTINPGNVKEEAREALIKYQLECYEALYRYFSVRARFVEEKQNLIDKQLNIISEAKQNFNSAKNVLNSAEDKLKKIRAITIDDYIDADGQLRMFD